jgi:NADH-quinone oxidoreductase subunit N
MIISGHESMVGQLWTYFITIISILTMTVGNIAAIGQRSVKRMLAYSSISHAGFMLTALLVLNEIGARSLVFYGIIYLFMTLVAFMITEAVSDHYGNDYFDRFRGFVQRYPLMAIVMIIVMLSLAGIPPLAGFVAKFNILAALIQKKFYGVAVIAGVNSVIALYYYMKIVRLMIFKEPESRDNIEGFDGLGQFVPTLFTFPVLFLGIFWQGILVFANGAKIFIK